MSIFRTTIKPPISWKTGLAAGLCLLVVPSEGRQIRTAAIAVKDQFDSNGNNFVTDSYDSSNPFLSIYGRYDPNHVGDNGDIVCNGTTLNSIIVGNGNVYGHVATGPNGTASIGNNGGVGTHAYQASNPGTFQPGYYSHDSAFTFPDTTLPYNSGLPLGAGTNVVTVTFNISSNYVGSSSTYPNPPPWSGVTTNTSYVTVSVYPNPAPAGLITNVTLLTSTLFPAPGSYIGQVVTNYAATNSASYPTPGSYVGPVATNTAAVASNSYPAAGTYVGAVTTNYTYVVLINMPRIIRRDFIGRFGCHSE